MHHCLHLSLAHLQIPGPSPGVNPHAPLPVVVPWAPHSSDGTAMRMGRHTTAASLPPPPPAARACTWWGAAGSREEAGPAGREGQQQWDALRASTTRVGAVHTSSVTLVLLKAVSAAGSTSLCYGGRYEASAQSLTPCYSLQPTTSPRPSASSSVLLTICSRDCYLRPRESPTCSIFSSALG